MDSRLRCPVAQIDLAALRHNARVARRYAGKRQILAAVKADAYGHGMIPVARALADLVDGMIVATVGEGEALRKAGITQRIMVLQGFSDLAEASRCARAMLEPVIHDLSQVAILSMGSTGLPLTIWLKFDSGMHRLGLSPSELSVALSRLKGIEGVRKPFQLMTHFARADERDHNYTAEQIAQFNLVLQSHRQLIGQTSLANSAGTLGWPQAGGDCVRPGIMLYGGNPFVDGRAADFDLKPVMHLRTRLIAVRRLNAGDPVGYGGSWVAPEDMPVGVAAIGYGDGYPRHAPSGTPVAVNGQRARLVGRVSMDLIMIDLRGIQAAVGDPVELWGDQVHADEVAQVSGTIAYELFCAVSGRVYRQYLQ